MEKEPLQKVIFTHWSNPPANGFFHRWADVYDNDVEAIVTVALVEDMDGNVLHVTPNRVTFDNTISL